MANNIAFLPDSKLSRCRNINYAKLDQKIDALDYFEIVLGNPTGWQITDIVDDVEANITVGNHTTHGYVKNHKYNRSSGLLTIAGWDYMIKLAGMFIHTDNVTQEDATLSSDFRVVYTAKAFAVIAADLITNSGFTAGTINTFPVAGPDTTMGVKYEDMYVRDGLKYLADYANVSNVTYDFWIDTSKRLQLQDRRGSATSVKDYHEGINCNLINHEGDTIRKAKRVLVRGDRSGASQVTGVWPAAGFTPGDPEVGFYMPGLTDQTMATQLAKNLYTALGGEITFIELNVGNVNDNVQLGDLITFTSTKLSISATDYRVVRIIREYWRDRESLKLFLSVSTNKNRKKTMTELLSGNKGLTRLTGSASTGIIKTLCWSAIVNAENANKLILGFNISTDIVRSNSDILASRLNVKRLPLTYDLPSTTDNHPHGQNYFTQSTHPHVQNYFTQTTHPHDQNYFTQTNHVHSVSGTTSADAGGGSASSGYQQYLAEDNIGTSWGDVWTISAGGFGNHTQNFIVHINCNQDENIDATRIGRMRLQFYDGANNKYYPSEDGAFVAIPGGTSYDFLFGISFFGTDDAYGYQIRLQGRWLADPGTHDHFNLIGYYQYVDQHGHTISGQTATGTPAVFTAENVTDGETANFTDPNSNQGANASFTNANATVNAQAAINRGKYAPGGEGNLNFNYDLDGGNLGTWNALAVNGTASADITVGTTGQHYIDIYPTGGGEIATLVVDLEVDVITDEL